MVSRKESYIEKVLCDICGAEIREESYRISDVEISSRIGDSFPEGSSWVTKSIDCCAECFSEKVIPLVEKEFGIKFQEEEHES